MLFGIKPKRPCPHYHAVTLVRHNAHTSTQHRAALEAIMHIIHDMTSRPSTSQAAHHHARTIQSTRHALTITRTQQQHLESAARRMRCCVTASRSSMCKGRGTLRMSWLHKHTKRDQVLTMASSSGSQASYALLTPWPAPMFVLNQSCIPS